MNSPIISIIVPVYNTADFLKKCLNSIANQTLKNIEVILVDDGSTDCSLDICNQFAVKHNNFLVYTKTNEGQGVARNIGLAKSHGQFICYVDSDDWIEPSMCEDVILVLDQTNADFANFGVDFISNEGKVVKKIDHFDVTELTGDELFLNALIDRYILSTACNKIYRRSFLLEKKILFPPFRVNEDLFYSRAVSYYANKAVFISNVYYHALVRPSSTSRKMSAQMFITSEKLIRYEQDFFSLRLQQENCQPYFQAHVAKFFSYMLIQAAFRISDYAEYRSCFDISKRVDFYNLCTRKEVVSKLRYKGRVMLIVCKYPSVLRALAIIAKKLGLSSFFVY
jgi:glycosyltransferase involved in cell wall biosynthesis